jgi:hypothetical protein
MASGGNENKAMDGPGRLRKTKKFFYLPSSNASLCGLLLLLTGCRGSVPLTGKLPSSGLAGYAMALRVTLPNGAQSSSARAYLNLEEPEGSERYQIELLAGRAFFAQVEPGNYHLEAVRNPFGWSKERIEVHLFGQDYELPVPQAMRDMPSFELSSGQVLPAGRLDVAVSTTASGARLLGVSWNTSRDARRDIIERLIQAMADPSSSEDFRETVVPWMSALEQALSRIYAEPLGPGEALPKKPAHDERTISIPSVNR